MDVAVVQARMGSERLPGKVLGQLGQRPVVAWVIRAALSSQCDDVIVATTQLRDDDAIVELAQRMGVRWHRGEEDDVLSRFLGATATLGPGDLVVRLTADNPFVDPALIDAGIARLKAEDGDYFATAVAPSMPLGVGVEVVRVAALRHAAALATEKFHRIHVTSYIHTHPNSFSVLGGQKSPRQYDFRATLDTEPDAKLLEVVVGILGDRVIPWSELGALLQARPDIAALNAGVQQKRIEDG